MTTSVIFNKVGYEPFIDFLKAYSIICVVVAHCMQVIHESGVTFVVWGGMQVPMFVLIQVFHAYKKGLRPCLNIRKLWSRIMLPFLFVQLLIILVYVINGKENVMQLCKNFIGGGGFGPGSYYPWIYLQIALILTLVYHLCIRLNRHYLICIFACISIFGEFICSIINLPEWIYRVIFVRYLFLIPLGMEWIENGINMNMKNFVLSVISILAVLFFAYNDLDLEPVFFNTGWKTHRWVCYYYVAFLMPWLLYIAYNYLRNSRILKVISEIGKSSYEIFLVQMLLFALWPTEIINSYYGLMIHIVICFGGSLIFGWLFWRTKGILLERQQEKGY